MKNLPLLILGLALLAWSSFGQSGLTVDGSGKVGLGAASGGSGGVVTGPSVVSNSSAGVPIYLLTSQPGFTNIFARPGQRAKGINMVLRPGQGAWYVYFSNDSFFHFVTNDVALAKGLGFTSVRLISDQIAIYTNAITEDLMLSRYEWFVKHCFTNGMDVYACSGDGNRYSSPPTGAELTFMTNYTQRFAAMLSSNSNVRGLDILQEVHPWDSDTTELANATNAIQRLYAAAKRGAPNIPATFSWSLNSGNLSHTDIRAKLIQLIDTTCDFNDVHIYVGPYPGNFYLMTNYTKPFVIGEIGVNNSESPLAQKWKYRAALSLSTHPQCEGIYWWTLTDQSTTASDMWGWYTTNNLLKGSNYIDIGRAATSQRNAPFTVFLGTSDGSTEQATVAVGATTNLGIFYFRTQRAGRMEITAAADINPSAAGLVIVRGYLNATNGTGYASGTGFNAIHGNTATGQRLTAAGSGDWQFSPGIYELRFSGISSGGGAGEIYSPQSNAKIRVTYDENP